MTMKKLILYHGSKDIIKQPEYGKGKPYNDYGLGFYCTENLDLAKEWACSENISGFANKYEFDTTGLAIMNLSSNKYMVLNWLAVLLQNRNFHLSTPLSRQGREYILKNFLPDYYNYDVIIGYRADDSYFSFARAFLSNEISLRQLGYAMKLGKLGEQYVLKSKKAFSHIRFLGSISANNSIYYEKRKERDDEARVAFQIELENEDLDGIFLNDILRQEMKQNDPRLL